MLDTGFVRTVLWL